MDSFTQLITDLSSWYWWFSVVIIGILINIASAYIKPSIDRLYERMFSTMRLKDETKRLERLRKAEELAYNSEFIIFEGLAEMRERIGCIFIFVLGLGLNGLGHILKSVYRSSDSHHSMVLFTLYNIVDVVGIICIVFCLAMHARANERSDILKLAKRKLQDGLSRSS